MAFMSAPSRSGVSVRVARMEDIAACGPICHTAFHEINTRHNFPPDLPSAEAAGGILTQMFSHPRFYCVVAEVDGKVAGSNCLDERSPIAGVGPITVDPSVQNRGVGRMLMQAVIERALARHSPGIRLV